MDFSKGATVVNFILPTRTLREKHFSTKKLIKKYKISKSRWLVPPDPLPTPMIVGRINLSGGGAGGSFEAFALSLFLQSRLRV